jgi:hypothetical protein
MEIAVCLRRIYHPKGKFATKTSLAVNSMEYCCCLLDEGNIRIRLGGGDHKAMTPP